MKTQALLIGRILIEKSIIEHIEHLEKMFERFSFIFLGLNELFNRITDDPEIHLVLILQTLNLLLTLFIPVIPAMIELKLITVRFIRT